jgi:hypothetical protein
MPSDRTTADSRRVVCPGQRACLDGIDGPRAPALRKEGTTRDAWRIAEYLSKQLAS